MAFSRNAQRRRDDQRRRWEALPPEERERREAELMEEAKILAEAGRKALEDERRES